jgi:hypothetical protein
VATYASVAVGTLTVVKGVTPKVKAAFTAKSVKHTKRAKLNVRVSASGVKRPAGQVTVTWQKGKTKDSATYTLKASKRGKATLNLPKIKKKGSYKVTVTFTGTGRVGTASARTKLRVT